MEQTPAMYGYDIVKTWAQLVVSIVNGEASSVSTVGEAITRDIGGFLVACFVVITLLSMAVHRLCALCAFSQANAAKSQRFLPYNGNIKHLVGSVVCNLLLSHRCVVIHGNFGNGAQHLCAYAEHNRVGHLRNSRVLGFSSSIPSEQKPKQYRKALHDVTTEYLP